MSENGDRPELPEGWDERRLGDIVKFAKKPKGLSVPDEVPFIPMALLSESSLAIDEWELRAEATSGTYFESGDVLLARITPCFENGKLGIAPKVPSGWGLATTEVYALRSDKLMPRFLAYLFTAPHVRAALLPAMEGATGRMRVPKEAVEELVVPVPPRVEQERIVASLDRTSRQLAAGIDQAERAKALMDPFLEGMAARAFRAESGDAHLLRKADASEADLDPAGEPDVMGSLPDLPDEWVWTTLGDLVSEVTSGSRDWRPYYNRGTDVFLLAGNIRMRHLDLSAPFFVDPPSDDPARARSEVNKDDILITIVGANVGMLARVPEELSRHYVCQSVALVRPKDAHLSEYLEAYLSSRWGGQAFFRSKFYGQGRPHLNFADIKSTPVPLPPEGERERIVKTLSLAAESARGFARDLDKILEGASVLRRSVLTAAFGGRLTEWSETKS